MDHQDNPAVLADSFLAGSRPAGNRLGSLLADSFPAGYFPVVLGILRSHLHIEAARLGMEEVDLVEIEAVLGAFRRMGVLGHNQDFPVVGRLIGQDGFDVLRAGDSDGLVGSHCRADFHIRNLGSDLRMLVSLAAERKDMSYVVLYHRLPWH